MANFPRINALGYNLNDPLPSADVNLLDTHHTKAPNFDEGSSHSNTSPIVLGGTAGMVLGTAGTPYPFGGYFTGAPNQAIWRGVAPVFEAGIVMDGVGDNASLLYFQNSADAQWTSGCTALFASGATLTVAGDFAMAGVETQTGKRVLSGDNALTELRRGTAAVTGTYGAEKDVWQVPSDLGGVQQTFTLRHSTAPIPGDGTPVEFMRDNVGADAVGSVLLESEAAVPIATMAANTKTNIELIYVAASGWNVRRKTTWT